MSRDRGASDALALVLIAPAMLGFAMVVSFLGRQVDARAQVRGAAESAAQAAALERSIGLAEASAMRAVDGSLGSVCEQPRVRIDLTELHPGGRAVVTVECDVSTRGLGLVPLPARRVSATAVASIDPFRAMEAAA